jgi:NAD(P)-dependent dehydrogenase (short-subunit alcohol dehydrogenase family)
VPGVTQPSRQNRVDRTILITGATGYLGRLAAAALAEDGSARLVVLTRGRHEPGSVVARIAAEAGLIGIASDERPLDRIVVVSMPDVFDSAAVVHAVRQ